MIIVKSQRLQERTYDVHGILRMRVRSPHPHVLAFFDGELGHFQSATAHMHDIEVLVDRFQMSSAAPSRLTGRNYALEETIYGSDRHKIARWRFAIQGLDQQTTHCYCTGGPFALSFLHNRYVEQLLRYKLSERGYTMVHGGCLSCDGQAVLFPGLMHTGKTMIAVHLARRGWEFQSDDYAIIGGDGRTYSYPSRLHFSNHVKERYPEALETIGPRRRVSMAIKRAISQLTFGYGNMSEACSIHEIVPDVAIADTANLDHVMLLSTHTGTRLKGPLAMTTCNALERILAINWREGSHFWNVLLESACMNVPVPLTQRMDRERQIVAAALQGSSCYELLIPRRIADFRDLLAQIGDLIEQTTGLSPLRRSTAAYDRDERR